MNDSHITDALRSLGIDDKKQTAFLKHAMG